MKNNDTTNPLDVNNLLLHYFQTLNTSANASHAAFGYMSNYSLRLRRKTKYSPQVEGVKLPSEDCAGAFNPIILAALVDGVLRRKIPSTGRARS